MSDEIITDPMLTEQFAHNFELSALKQQWQQQAKAELIAVLHDSFDDLFGASDSMEDYNRGTNMLISFADYGNGWIREAALCILQDVRSAMTGI